MNESSNDASPKPARPAPHGKRVIRDHRDLRVWKQATHLAAECERHAILFPPAGSDVAEQLTALARAVPFKIEEGQQARALSVYLEKLADAEAALHAIERAIIRSYSAWWIGVEPGDRLLMRVADIRRMLKHLVQSLEQARKGRVAARTRA